MSPARFQEIRERYPLLRLGVVGDFCLDRYFEIDPARQETSIETGLPVHNVVRVRSQPGGAGTILNNLAALGVGSVFPVGFCGTDGEGFELQRALRARGGCVHLEHFFATDSRRTFTYGKPLVLHPSRPPEELSRLDIKNWTPTPALVEGRLADSLARLAGQVDALIVLDQVDVAGTGVATAHLLEALAQVVHAWPDLLVIADSRRGLRGYPPVALKMNAAELAAATGARGTLTVEAVADHAAGLALHQQRPVFVTLAERGMVGASATGQTERVAALPVRGPIDIVGAGDAVTANLAAALAAKATLREAMELASAAASVVLHQLGTTGTASPGQIGDLLLPPGRPADPPSGSLESLES